MQYAVHQTAPLNIFIVLYTYTLQVTRMQLYNVTYYGH